MTGRPIPGILSLLLALCLTTLPSGARAQRLRVPEHALDPGAMARALETLPGAEVSIVRELNMDHQTLYAQLITGEAPADILPLRSDAYDVQQMVRKGYLLDLSAEPVLLAFSQDSLEAFAPLIFEGDGLYALPVGLEVTYLAASAGAFAAIGRPIPDSLPALLDLASWWAQEGYARHPEYSLFDSAGVKATLRQLIHASYVDGMVGAGLPLHFDGEGYGSLMERLDRLDVSSFDEDSDKPRGIADASPLLMPGWTCRGDQRRAGQQDIRLVALSVDGRQPAWRLGVGSMLAIPATSPMADAARRFLDAYLAQLPEVTRAALSRSRRQPVVNPDFDREREEQAGIVAYLEQMVAQAPEGAEKRANEEGLLRARAELDDFERLHRCLLDAGDLAAHQERMARVYLSDSLGIVLQRALLQENTGFHMYAQGALSLEQFIQLANDNIRLMTLEAD